MEAIICDQAAKKEKKYIPILFKCLSSLKEKSKLPSTKDYDSIWGKKDPKDLTVTNLLTEKKNFANASLVSGCVRKPSPS